MENDELEIEITQAEFLRLNGYRHTDDANLNFHNLAEILLGRMLPLPRTFGKDLHPQSTRLTYVDFETLYHVICELVPESERPPIQAWIDFGSLEERVPYLKRAFEYRQQAEASTEPLSTVDTKAKNSPEIRLRSEESVSRRLALDVAPMGQVSTPLLAGPVESACGYLGIMLNQNECTVIQGHNWGVSAKFHICEREFREHSATVFAPVMLHFEMS